MFFGCFRIASAVVEKAVQVKKIRIFIIIGP